MGSLEWVVLKPLKANLIRFKITCNFCAGEIFWRSKFQSVQISLKPVVNHKYMYLVCCEVTNHYCLLFFEKYLKISRFCRYLKQLGTESRLEELSHLIFNPYFLCDS